MLRPKKKITRKELKEDALVTSYAKVTKFYGTHKRQISIGITAVVVVVIAAIIYTKNRTENNEVAFSQLGGIYSYFDNGQYQAAIDGVPEKNLTGLKSIVEEYGSTAGGNAARFYLANAYYNLGKYAEALAQFDAFSPGDETFTVSRFSGMGASEEGLGNCKEAAGLYERAASLRVSDASAAENLSNAARNYARAGEKEKALQLYKRVKKDYPTTSYGREADRNIAELSV